VPRSDAPLSRAGVWLTRLLLLVVIAAVVLFFVLR
jgi:hypothetical protein